MPKQPTGTDNKIPSQCEECDNGFFKENKAGGAYWYQQCPKKNECFPPAFGTKRKAGE